MEKTARKDLAHDLFLPMLLFAALGGMTWAVRGSAGFGAVKGCIFAGVAWGTAWWFIARESSGTQSRPYASGWIVLALTVGVGIAGNRGWMQWPHFFNNRLYLDFRKGEFVPISRTYGFVWLFLAGVPWAGLGACLLAWCSTQRLPRAWQWLCRILFGLAGAFVLLFLLRRFPNWFLPLYDSLEAKYNDLDSYRNLWKLVRDTREGLTHLGLYLGFLLFEIVRRDWKNVTLILTVGLVNGTGWALCQNWMWAERVWPQASFNWWRCWESSGGISIGIAYGIAYYLVNRKNVRKRDFQGNSLLAGGRPNLEWLLVYLGLILVLGVFITEELGFWGLTFLGVAVFFGIAYYRKNRGILSNWNLQRDEDPNLERLGLYSGLFFGVFISVMNGLRGVAVVYHQDEEMWRRILTHTLCPLMLIGFVWLIVRILKKPVSPDYRGDIFPHRYCLTWLALIALNLIAQAITFQPFNWNEVVFSLYYLLLFLMTAVILFHFQWRRRCLEGLGGVSGNGDHVEI